MNLLQWGREKGVGASSRMDVMNVRSKTYDRALVMAWEGWGGETIE